MATVQSIYKLAKNTILDWECDEVTIKKSHPQLLVNLFNKYYN